MVLPSPARYATLHLHHRACRRTATPQPAAERSPISHVDRLHSTRGALRHRAPVTRPGRKRSAPGIRPCPTIPGPWWNHRRKRSTPAPAGAPFPRIPTTVGRRRPASTRPPARTAAPDSGVDLQRRRAAPVLPSGPAPTPPSEEWASVQVILSAPCPTPQRAPAVPNRQGRISAHRAPPRPGEPISVVPPPLADHLGRCPTLQGEPISGLPSGRHHAVSYGALRPPHRSEQRTDRRTATQRPSIAPIPGTDCRRRCSPPCH